MELARTLPRGTVRERYRPITLPISDWRFFIVTLASGQFTVANQQLAITIGRSTEWPRVTSILDQGALLQSLPCLIIEDVPVVVER